MWVVYPLLTFDEVLTYREAISVFKEVFSQIKRVLKRFKGWIADSRHGQVTLHDADIIKAVEVTLRDCVTGLIFYVK